MQRHGDIKSGYQWTGGLALHEVLQDLGMRVGRAWVRAHGSWGWRGAGQGGAARKSSRRIERESYGCRGILSSEVESYNHMSSRVEARLPLWW